MTISPDTLETAPDHFLFPKHANRGQQKLTAKQKKFARQVAMGMTKADAYRSAYEVTSEHSMRKDPYTIAANPRVSQEIETIQRAIEAQTWQTPSALRSLVISSLVKVITDPDSKPAQVINAAKVLGTVTEVAAFTERKEVRTISTSEDARARVLEQLRAIVKAEATDAEAIEHDAQSLLAELEPHRGAGGQSEQAESLENVHTIPHEQILSDSDPHEQTPSKPLSENSQDQEPTPSIQEDPPL